MDARELAEKIKQIRGYEPQAAFGQRFGVTRQVVFRWEKAIAIPSPKILAALGIRVEYHEETARPILD